MRRESIGRLLLGLSTGTVFGFLLHKSRATEYEKISGQLRLKDPAVIEIMGAASTVGALGTQLLVAAGLTENKVKPLNLGGITIGGVLFGTGMALLGYCPGTTLAAVGKGRKDAAAGLLGMLGGALAFVKLYPRLKPVIEAGAYGSQTLPKLTRTSPWLWIAGTGAVGGVEALFTKGGKKSADLPSTPIQAELDARCAQG